MIKKCLPRNVLLHHSRMLSTHSDAAFSRNRKVNANNHIHGLKNHLETKHCENAVNRWFVEDFPEPTEAHPQRRPVVLSSFRLSIIVLFCLSSNGNDIDPLMEEPPVAVFTHGPTGEAQTA